MAKALATIQFSTPTMPEQNLDKESEELVILGSEEIKLLLKARNPILDPYCGKAIEGSGLEVRIDKLAEFGDAVSHLGVISKSTPDLIDLETAIAPEDCGFGIESRGWWLEQGISYHLTILEKINMPLDLSGVITPRSTLQRCGVGLFVANIAPGYHGELSFGIINFHSQPFFLERLARVAFIQFVELKNQEPECCYKGNWQGGVRSTSGITVEHICGVHNSTL